jgi:hypothetical protein
MGGEPIFIDVFVEPNDNAPDGCGLRFKTEERPRVARRVQLDGQWHEVVGWSSAGGGSACTANAALVEDSGAGTAMLVYGGDWGIRLLPVGGGAPVGESHLVLDESAVELLP